MIEAVACQDGMCDVVSSNGVCVDGRLTAIYFIPGPNMTTVITVFVLVGYKVLIY